MPQLDGIRGIAVLMVIVSHWLPHNRLVAFLPLGGIGVDIFFVLSGFLITRILLAERYAPKEQTTRKERIRIFYLKRALRIFPAYYGLLFVIWMLNVADARAYSGWYASYLANVYIYETKVWNITTHLWSLAVEEQFYLVWPFVIMFIPGRYLPKFFVLLMAAGPLSRYLFHLADPTIFNRILTINCIDTLGIGGGWHTCNL
jgi:peptidoglycan/LPS O-acetylase OafA/YrhL